MTELLNVNGTKSLNPDQIAVVDLVKECLAQALEGNITSIAIVACMSKGFAHVMAGRQAAELNLGCDALKAEILVKTARSGAGTVVHTAVHNQ